MEGKLIIIEGNDCSGKETQCKLLVERLKKEGYDVFTMAFPRYDTPTGKIIGGPLLGKPHIGESYFDDPANLDPKVTGLYYAIDRLYHTPEIKKNLSEGKIVVLDRYTTSNMACQGGKFATASERALMFQFYEKLEYELLGLAKPDGVILLHMPYDNVVELRSRREEAADKVEIDESYLRHSEQAYLEMKDIYDFKYISCAKDGKPRDILEISEDVYNKAKEIIDGK